VSSSFDYFAYDPATWGAGIDVDAVLAALTDELLATGDLDAALQRLARRGMTLPDGQKLMGLRQMIERLRQQRAQLQRQGDPNGEVERLRERLEEIESIEREAIDRLEIEAEQSGDAARQAATAEMMNEKRLALDLLPDALAGRMRSFLQYTFVSSDAREKFDAFMDELRAEVGDTFVQQMKDALQSQDDGELARMKEAFSTVNAMMERQARGEDVDATFALFKERFGDLFPGAETFEELVDQLAKRMAASAAIWRSLSQGQRNELSEAMRDILQDAQLLDEIDRLAYNLQGARPDLNWQASYSFDGEDALSLSQAAELAESLGALDRLEELLGSGLTPGSLGEVDFDEVNRLLGADVAQSLETLANVVNEMKEAGLIDQRGGESTLTPKAVRRLGQQALADLFSNLRKEHMGSHSVHFSGTGHDREETTRPYQFGDPFTLDLSRTVHNAIRRSGGGVPVTLTPDDFEVVETEALSRAATVLCVDLSMSMPMRDNFVPAKKMAMALHALITNRFPRDYFALVGFSEVAREIKPAEFPNAMWDYVYGTNLQHALALSRSLLAHRQGARQIIVVTDGEPTAHIGDDGLPHFHYPPRRETLTRTMAEVVACTRAGITINVFALDIDHTVFPFVEQIARVNGGRTFATTPDELGGYVLVDFLKNRRINRLAG
jgi:uncharacterized protein with von Willebrand factor type A (vWA) domain